MPTSALHPLLCKAGVVDDQHPVGRTELLPDQPLQLGHTAGVIPGGVADQLLQLAGWRADLLGDVLHVLPRDRQQQPSHIPLPPRAPLRPTEELSEAGMERLQLRQQRCQVLAGDRPRPCRCCRCCLHPCHPPRVTPSKATATVKGGPSRASYAYHPPSVDNRRCSTSVLSY